MSIEKVIKEGFCVGCGACKVSSADSVSIEFQEEGYYEANVKNKEALVSEVCPFSDDSINETELGAELYSSTNDNYDTKVGFYIGIYAGNVTDETQRLNASSGGLTSWITEQLLLTDQVDAVVHVGESDKLFGYQVSRSIEELRSKNRKKSRYYPVSYNDVLNELKDSKERIAFVGIPCFIKSIRLLQKSGTLKNIKYCISLLCGHMKLEGFAQSLAWQSGVHPRELKSVDFRVKKEGFLASSYFFQATNKAGMQVTVKNGDLLGANWGLGFFKHKACDFCDDIGGELADITLGDAWLPKYTQDYLGTNIMIVRNKVIQDLLESNGLDVSLEKVDVETFFNTQAGNYRNRRGGILARTSLSNEWLPKKRLELCKEYEGDNKQSAIYRYRTKISKASNDNFIRAKRFNSILLFKILMLPKLLKYNFLLNGFKGAIRTVKIFLPIKKEIKFK